MSYTDLPQEICDEDAIRTTLLKQRKAQDVKPDRRLDNWQKWVKDRDKINERLSKKLNRHHCELITNYGESLNAVKNDKLVLEYTKIPYPHDKYRGNPSFFESPIALKKKHPCDPDYFAVQTKQDVHLIPEVEYVGVPKCIQDEKPLSCEGYRSAKDVWLESAYRKERVKKLEDQLKIIEPFKPQMDDLCIVGKSLKVSPQRKVSVPAKRPEDDFKIAYAARPILRGESDTKLKPRASTYNKHENEEFISVNDVRLCPHVNKEEQEVFLDFNYDISSGKPLTKGIEIKNGTSVTIRYFFTESSKFYLFKEIHERDHEQVFFFDKRTNIILPNETKMFNIHFKTNLSSYYTSTLQFHRIPKVFMTKLFIKLTATSAKEEITERVKTLKQYIENKVKNSAVHDVIEDVLESVPKTQSHMTLYTYDRGYIFEAVNQNFSPTIGRPKYIYDKEVVDELEVFYAKVKFKGCPSYWNYDVGDLKRIIRKREKLDRQKDTLDQVYLMRLEDLQRRKCLGENIDEEVKHIKKKTSNNSESNLEVPFSDRLELLIKDLKDTISNKEEKRETLTAELENILLKLDTACYSINNMYDSYGYVYAILCITFDRIIFDIEKIRDILRINTLERYPPNLKTFPFQSIQNEVFMDEDHPKHPKIEPDFIQEGQPASELLKDVPHEDVKVRHVAYFGIQGTEDAKGKKGKKDKKKAKKEPDKKSKGKKGEKDAKPQKVERPSTPQVDLKPSSDFANPFRQRAESNVSLAKSLSQHSEDQIPESIYATSIQYQLEEYRLNLYKIFYKHLSQAVVRIADVIETYKHRKLKYVEFNTIWKQTVAKQRPIKVRYIDIKKTLSRVIGLKIKKKRRTKEKKRKKKTRMIKLTEPLRPKEGGSQWSFLRPTRRSQPPQTPISYPELCLLVRKKEIQKQAVDVGTIMSVCSGFDVDWKDFKDASVQAESESYQPATWESRGVATGIVQDVVSEICDKESVGDEVEDIGMAEEIGGEEEESDVFFDEDFSDSELDLSISDLYNPNT